MPFAIVLAPEAVEDLRRLTANVRATVRTALETHLRQEPEKTSRSRARFLREAETQEIVIRRHGKPAGVLIGFESEEDWFEYRLEHDPRFLRRIEQARNSLRAGPAIRLVDVASE